MEEDKKFSIMDKLAHKPMQVLKFQKVFNNFCRDCKKLAFANSHRPMKEYCDKCQKKIRRILGDEIEL